MRKATDVFKKLDMVGGPLQSDGTRCWPFLGEPNNKGLAYVQYKGKKELVHRVVYRLVHGPDSLPDGVVVRHTCDNGRAPVMCGNPNHLVKGSHQDNMNDMKERDRHGVPAHVVRAIRRLARTPRADGTANTHAAIAELYGLARQTVTDIINGETHGHVEDQDPDQ